MPARRAPQILTADDEAARFEAAVAEFDAGRFHEAQEELEPLWHAAAGARRTWLQGLLQVSAAFFHYGRGSAFSFHDLLRSGVEKLDAGGAAATRIDALAFRAALAAWVEHGARVAAGGDLRTGAPSAAPRLRPR